MAASRETVCELNAETTRDGESLGCGSGEEAAVDSPEDLGCPGPSSDTSTQQIDDDAETFAEAAEEAEEAQRTCTPERRSPSALPPGEVRRDCEAAAGPEKVDLAFAYWCRLLMLAVLVWVSPFESFTAVVLSHAIHVCLSGVPTARDLASLGFLCGLMANAAANNFSSGRSLGAALVVNVLHTPSESPRLHTSQVLLALAHIYTPTALYASLCCASLAHGKAASLGRVIEGIAAFSSPEGRPASSGGHKKLH